MKFFTSGNEMESIANFKANKTMWPNEESILIVIGNVSERKCRECVAQSRRFLGRFQQPSGSPWHRHNHWREHDNSGFFSLHHRHRSVKLSYSTFNLRGSKICCTVDFITYTKSLLSRFHLSKTPALKTFPRFLWLYYYFFIHFCVFFPKAKNI